MQEKKKINSKMRSEQWFVARISKRIFRDKDECSCDTCQRVVEEGLIVADKQHAIYLFDIQNEWAEIGLFLNYRDKK